MIKTFSQIILLNSWVQLLSSFGWEARVRGGNPKSYSVLNLNFGYDLKVIAI